MDELDNVGETGPTVAFCALGCPLPRPETTERLEISGLSSIVCLVELGGIETQKSVRDVHLDRGRPWIQGCVQREDGLFGDSDPVAVSGEEQFNFDTLHRGGVSDVEQCVDGF